MEEFRSTLSTVSRDGLFIVASIALLSIIAGISYLTGHSAGVEYVQETSSLAIEEDSLESEILDEDEVVQELREPIELSGVGQTATDPIELEAGLATVKINHSGSHHFSIWVLDEYGDKIELLVNETGNFDGSKAFQIPSSGRYVLDVSADGPWVIVFQQ